MRNTVSIKIDPVMRSGMIGPRAVTIGIAGIFQNVPGEDGAIA